MDTHSNVLPKDRSFSFRTIASLEIVDKVAREHGIELEEEVVHTSFQVQEEELRGVGYMEGKKQDFRPVD